MKKRFLALAMSMVMAVSLCACGGKSDTDSKSDSKSGDKKEASAEVNATDDGKVLNIYCWNDEFQSRVAAYYPDYVDNGDGTGKIGDVTVKWTMNENEGNNYQDKLDVALNNQESAAADDKVDIFLIEADYALKYVNSDFSLDVKGLGLTDDDMSQMYQYTKDICTDESGALKGVSWQATPGLFAYRRSIAKDVLGTDDPEKVQEALSDWDKFDAVAKQAADKGYKMLSGYDDAYRTFSNNVAGPWVQDDKIVVDASIDKWIDQTKTYTDAGYTNKSSLWDTTWAADQGPKGKVFGFFYSTWGINFTLLGNSLETAVADGGKEEAGNGAYGDYAVCQGPASYFWGGTWICGANGTDNKSLVCDVMKQLTCNADIMKKITEETQDYTNNMAAMEEIANSDFQSAFLGGQNHIKLFAEAAKKIDMSNISPYDQGLNEGIQTAMKDYFDGNCSKEEAMDKFYKAAVEKYPELSY
jgi:predicted small lipoprotein YifL